MTEEEKEGVKILEDEENIIVKIGYNDYGVEHIRKIYDDGEKERILNYIEKLQKENAELKEKNKYQYELLGKFEKHIDKETIMKIYDEDEENEELKEENKILTETLEIYNKNKKEIGGLNEEEKLLYRLTGMMVRDKELEQLIKEHYVSKDKIKEIKEKIHLELDIDGISCANQFMIDRYFEKLLKE